MHMQRLTAAPGARARWILVLASLVTGLVAACGSGDRPLDQVDPDSVPAEPTYDQVYAIIDRECVPCHKSGDDGGEDYAYSAPGARAVLDDAPKLNDCTSVVAQRNEIWTTIENNSMPPGAWPRLTSEERLMIRRWIDNGAPAPCNPPLARLGGGVR